MDLFTPPSKSLFSVCILALNFRWHVMLFSLLLCQKICSSPVLQHIQKKTKQIERVGTVTDKSVSYLPVLYL